MLEPEFAPLDDILVVVVVVVVVTRPAKFASARIFSNGEPNSNEELAIAVPTLGASLMMLKLFAPDEVDVKSLDEELVKVVITF